MGQVEEIKRREKKEKLLEKSTKRIGDFQHRPGIPRDRSPSRRSSIVLTSDRLNFGNRRCASTSMRDKFKILAAASLSPQAHTLSYLFLADDPRRLFGPFFPPPSSLCRVHTTENEWTVVESRADYSSVCFLIEGSIYVYYKGKQFIIPRYSVKHSLSKNCNTALNTEFDKPNDIFTISWPINFWSMWWSLYCRMNPQFLLKEL